MSAMSTRCGERADGSWPVLAFCDRHLIGGDAKIVLGRIALLLGSVAVVGLSAGAIAVAGSMRTPVLTALRRE